eukprot:955076-Ditylum_brightwellii.AAC.1
MDIPAGIDYKDSDSTQKFVLRLKKNLYGLKQASYNWSELLKAGLINIGYKQSYIDPCLYIKYNIICVVCADNTLFFAPGDSLIDKDISKLKTSGFDLTDKGEVDAFLGIKFDKQPN